MQKREKNKVKITEKKGGNNGQEAIVKQNGHEHLIFAVLTCILIILVFFLGGRFLGTSNEVIKDEITPTPAGTTLRIPSNYYQTGAHKGSKNAPIILLEFGDYQCEFCQKFHGEAQKLIETEFIETQHVQFYYRDFPQIQLHDKGVVSAHAAHCALEQDMFWQMHDKLYEKTRIWSVIPKEAVTEIFSEYAREIGINDTQFTDCMNENKYAERITANLEDGLRIGVRGTPTFLVYLPKNNINESEAKELAYAARATPLEDQEYYIIMLEGNRNYAVFEAIFKSIQ